MSTRDAYLEKMKAQIDEWNAEIEKIEAKARGAQADAKIEYEKQLGTMRLQREKLRERMRDVNEANEDAFESLRESVENAWDELAKGFRDALNKYR
ncbi:MAG: hypothetical protein H2060_05725 [Azoarcus sp.]|nr:hypothetical protein [Azoarcus sp.]|tara:strand:- start:2831 stop:3118 length:288 start_codon:yes stop_codon:yes gene_type:complete